MTSSATVVAPASSLRRNTWVPALPLVLGALVALALGAGWVPAVPVLLALVGLGLVALTMWSPVAGLAILVLAVPLTTGLGRGTVVPLLRTSEAVTLAVMAGVLLREIPRRSRRPYSTLDLAVATFTLGAVIVPWLVLLVTKTPADLELARTVLAPAQYLVLYLLFSRVRLSLAGQRLLLNLTMATSIVVAVVAVAQLVDVAGFRDFLAGYYPLPTEGICFANVCRPTSLLEHWSSVGAFAVLNWSLALAIAATRQPGFSRRWLSVVMAVNLIGVLVSQTQATVIGLLLVTVLIIWYARRLPMRELRLPLAGLLLGLLVFAPQLTARVEQQLAGASTGNLVTPESLQTRIGYWDLYFFPALAAHPWVGTGTVIPAEIPERRHKYVDNEYLRLGFRAGLVGEVLLITMFVVICRWAWRYRDSADPWRRMLGAAAFADTVLLAVIGATGEYLTFAGITQFFWMMVGLLAAIALAARRPERTVVVVGGESSRLATGGVGVRLAPALAVLRRFVPERGLLRSSVIVFTGITLARFLGFLFSVAAARLLLPAGYGLLAYGLAVVGIASILVGNAPTGLSRFLARQPGSRDEQDAVFSNWLALVGLLLGISLVLSVPIGLFSQLGGWMLVGLAANLVGTAVLVTYREAQRGLERYTAMVAIYVLANILQLVTILALAAAGWRSAPLFLIVYGLSNVVALAMMQAVSPIRLAFVRGTLARERIVEVGRFLRPILVQTAFFAVWFGADLILVQRFVGSSGAGNYAAAKTLVNVLYLGPAAIATAIVPRVAQMGDQPSGRYLLRVLALTASISVPVLAALALFGAPITMLVFGDKYPQAAVPLTALGVGIVLWGFYLVLESWWVGLGRPKIDAVATAAGMIGTVGIGLLLVPAHGLNGAALAFAAGSAAQLLVIAGFTVRWFRPWDRGPRGLAMR
jgi:O-antigen/teichoic acid export membrane protein